MLRGVVEESSLDGRLLCRARCGWYCDYPPPSLSSSCLPAAMVIHLSLADDLALLPYACKQQKVRGIQHQDQDLMTSDRRSNAQEAVQRVGKVTKEREKTCRGKKRRTREGRRMGERGDMGREQPIAIFAASVERDWYRKGKSKWRVLRLYRF